MISTNIFWGENPSVLLDKQKLFKFFPTSSMTVAEKLNSITRLAIYTCCILTIYSGKTIYLISLIVILLVIYLFYFQDKKKLIKNKNIGILLKKPKPQKNPFGNTLILQGAKIENKKIKKIIPNKIFRDINNLENDRNFYHIPQDSGSNQSDFAKWLYS